MLPHTWDVYRAAACFLLLRVIYVAAVSQEDALIDIYDATGGSNWASKNNWKTGNPICSWQFVSCSSGKVTRLYVTSLLATLIKQAPGQQQLGWQHSFNNRKLNRAKGTVREHSVWFIFIRDRYMGVNHLTGVIPESIGSLTQLTVLYV